MTTEQDAGLPPADRHVATVLTGGQNGRGSSAGQGSSWPGWARRQLLEAVSVKEQVCSRGRGRALATELYRGWYNPTLGRGVEFARPGRPLVGTYRIAHAGSGSRILADGIALVDRHDAVGRDGWWRTWGDSWSPITSRRHCVRVLLSPHPSTLAEFVRTVTAALLDASEPWLLACTTDPRRLGRSGGAVLYVPDPAVLPAGLLDLLRPLLRPAAPPLCLPLGPGAVLVEFSDDGLSFGKHRCHLVALGLQRPTARRAPLEAVADVFASHGIDPAAPYRTVAG